MSAVTVEPASVAIPEKAKLFGIAAIGEDARLAAGSFEPVLPDRRSPRACSTGRASIARADRGASP